MRLHDIISSSLLPRFAEDAEWEQNALDVFVKAVRALSFGLGAPYTRKAISALTDADLQAYFLAYGIISYYPELSRQTRENMLFELARMYRFLGTPYAITALCRYIFDESDAVEVEVKDNLAFDDDGELIDASLLGLFDIAIDAQSASIGGSAGDRIVANVLKIARNSQALRNIYFRYEDEIQIPVRCADYIGFVYRIGDDYELSRPTGSADETLELLLGFRNTGSGWESVQPTSSSKFWAGILSQIDHYEAEKFGLQVHSNSSYAGPIGSIVIDYTFDVELLNVYTDIGGSNPVDKGDGWGFVAIDAASTQLVYLGIENNLGFATSVMSYRAKFTKRNSADITVYFTSSGGVTTSWTNGTTKSVYCGGEYVLFQNGKTYTLIGVYNGDTLLSGVDITTTNNTSYPNMTRIVLKNNSGATISGATRAVIRVTNPQIDEREAWFNANKTNYTFSSNRSLFNQYGLNFVENAERRFEIVRFEDENGNALTMNNTFSFGKGTYGVFRINITSGPAVTAAKIVYRSLPFTKRAWLNTSHTGQNLNAYTVYPLYDESGNHPSELSVTGDALLGLYDENGNAISFSSNDTVTNSGGYLCLYIGNYSRSNVAYIIYKET